MISQRDGQPGAVVGARRQQQHQLPQRRSGSRHPYPQRVAAHEPQPPTGGRGGRAAVSISFLRCMALAHTGRRAYAAHSADDLGSIESQCRPARRRAPRRRPGPGGALRPASAGCVPLHVRSVRDRAASSWRHPGSSTSGERVTTTTPTASSSRRPSVTVTPPPKSRPRKPQLASRAGEVVELLLRRPPVPKPASCL
jgi:hypothetical protein